MGDLVIELNDAELLHAATVGAQRRINGMKKSRPAYHGADTRHNEWQIDIIGCIGELALAKALNLYWDPSVVDNLQTIPGDVGFYQVRSTQHLGGHLFVHEYDKPEAPYVLAIVWNHKVKLAGWIYGKEREIGEPRSSGTHTTYWIPQKDLRPMEELLELRATF
jgi:hypothetical protein